MKKLSIAVLIGIITVLTFAAAGGYGLVNLDDYVYVLKHSEVTSGLSLAGVKCVLFVTLLQSGDFGPNAVREIWRSSFRHCANIGNML